ncbi:MAG: heat-inducible transcription repressor HrcA [Lachnospiraceae bacterium]|nr:heat-inducible transcription repressor HrcA [Lachnospiraceae bacterium]
MIQLDERKQKILDAIIRNYQETGEPVGSRTISKYTDLQLSSATIRNEMSDLEEMGLIVQPHTSAGRIPTDTGYRLYVDRLMKNQLQEVDQTRDFLLKRVDRLEKMLKQLAQLLAVNTNYATMISGPRYGGVKLKFIQLSRVEPTKLLAVVVAESNVIKNTLMDLEAEISDEGLLALNLLLNNNLSGLTLDEINLAVITRIKEQSEGHADIVEKVLASVAEAIRGEDELQIYTSGATNIFKYPELAGGDKASQILQAFEEKKQLTNLLTDHLNSEENQGIQVYIGEETSVQSMKDCSVVTATYELSDGVKGSIGIVGPKRMDYEKVVSTLQTLMTQMDLIYRKPEE